MINSLKTLAKSIQAKYIGEDVAITGAHINSKLIKVGDLFIAIKDKRDGHQYIQSAIEHGATAVLVSVEQKNLPIAQIVAKDTRKALYALALAHREKFTMPILSVTGSCGKTSTKEMLVQILSHFARVYGNPGNFNNDLGVPISILSAPLDCDYMVLEAGTNAPGEIEYLAKLIQPNVAGITNVSASHLEKLGSLDGVMEEKGALLQALTPSDTAIINHDDRRIYHHSEFLNCHKISFSMTEKGADLYLASHSEVSGGFEYTVRYKDISYQGILNVSGVHNIQNALMALGYIVALGLDLKEAIYALSGFNGYQGRFSLTKLSDQISLIDDTYNASVKSVEAAIETLERFEGTRILVLGSMGELGEHEIYYHKKIGQLIKAAHIDSVYLYGQKEVMAHVLENAGSQARYYVDKQEIINNLKDELQEAQDSLPTLVIVKGARVNKMEEIVSALKRM
ncbi:UDP-N-acetylmuramoyl-tripeptide--D-alanyl-D-alanine ligase [Fangia hongkongensis]|uniref:UDP-N-acetylmuramoyl-tripeptide--D-alanyl-D- alanine ligase n=2 Tax=Fangia hongkongensis TaxID=270495 RepID=UPI000380D344|nr:UDP-N-acetylmuramoyl-tripeptide--D-alanyl-D-alanine ligase [Fangia hongkongensis]